MLIESLKSIVGPSGWTSDPFELEPHLTEWRETVRGTTPIMVSPSTTAEVAEVVRCCAEAGAAIVPQGGNTGMCAGAVPDESGTQILLNLSRLNRIRHVDASNFSMIAEAGCILADLQTAASDVDRHFPLSLGAEGSCQIGGNLSTNAGGINVVRYGNARTHVLGLEVVLADGTIWDGLRSLRKDTAGYDMKQVFIGSEGTLGIITAAALRLYPDPGETTTLLLGIGSASDAVDLLGEFQSSLPDRIQAFELVGRAAFAAVEQYIPNGHLPFDQSFPWYVLAEVATPLDDPVLEALVERAVTQRRILDAVVAKNQAEADRLWRLRHSISEAEKHIGVGLKHDISVPMSAIRELLSTGETRVADAIPGAQVIAFGHVGDGNLHYNVLLPNELEGEERALAGERASTIVYDLVAELGGSFSAEHGVGVLKRPLMERYKSAEELALMRSLKSALDPKGILNPGKVL